MKKIWKWYRDSCYTTQLSPGCKECAKGKKLVLLITGLCPSNCFYCPLSEEKRGRDRIFADEWELKNEDETYKLVQEAEYINASGAGITGGDPLVVWERTMRYIELLKNSFGEKFHVHLYTSALKNTGRIEKLVSAGLDEIRYHPPLSQWGRIKGSRLSETIRSLKNLVDQAIEIPSIPGWEKEIIGLIKWADENHVKWVNLNELEYSETNLEELNRRGYTVKNDVSAAVKGSQETAYRVLNEVKNLDVGVHYCSSSFKDGVQLKNRLKNRAKNTAKKYEIVTDEGTLLKGIITSDADVDLSKTLIYLKKQNLIDEEYLFLNIEKKRIETAVWILEKISRRLKKQGFKCYMIEEYPTEDHLEVERVPLPVK